MVTDYSYALDVLDKYDHQQLSLDGTTDYQLFVATYEEAIKAIDDLKIVFGASSLFANEKDNSFKGSIGTIYQSFDGTEFYPTIEEKAANLLYFVVKNHSFSDGNKRIAAYLSKRSLVQWQSHLAIDAGGFCGLDDELSRGTSQKNNWLVKAFYRTIAVFKY